MRFGVVVFPGSNCDADTYHAVSEVLRQPVEYVWHQNDSVEGFDCIILPGGFSYGDYLRAGALAAQSTVMTAIRDFADRGGLVLGICNGFQVLCEAGLLPGALLANQHLQFACHWTHVRVETADSPFTCAAETGEVLRIPIAHQEGAYYVTPEELRRLEKEQRIAFSYCNSTGRVTREANPNGSVGNVAGVLGARRNVLGMMPHPERCAESILGDADGRKVFVSLINWWREGRDRG